MSQKCCALCVAVLLVSVSGYANYGDPIAGLGDLAFEDAKATFTKIDNPMGDGLGPVYNGVSCVACHQGPTATAAEGAVGGSDGTLETRFGKLNPDGSFDPMVSSGGSLIQKHGIGRAIAYLPNPAGGQPAVPPGCQEVMFHGERVPDDATVVARRRTTFLFGLGMVDHVPDSALFALRDSQPAATRGTVSIVFNPDTGDPNAVGKFGWKAQVPTLHVFGGDAYLNEMGVTNPSFPNENCPQGDCALLACNPYPYLNDDGGDVNHFAQFMTALAPPPRGEITAQVTAGEAVFTSVGCADCHTPTLTTGPSSLAQFNYQSFHPYSDFLLHDMGSLGDGITQNLATGKLMRTAPLWGLRSQPSLLHDGRATTLVEAIDAHDGQAAASKANFGALSASDQNVLLAFLRSL